MRLLRMFVVCVLAAGSFIALTAVPSSAGAPAVSVSPSTSLADGVTAVVRLHGLPPHTPVRVNQCDMPTESNNGDIFGCLGTVTVTTNGSGRANTPLVLHDVVQAEATGYFSWPVPCRDDHCRVYANWTDGDGNLQSATSTRLKFLGAAATITVTPFTNLLNGQRVKVAGTAYGAEGRTLVVSEEHCVGPGGGDPLPECFGLLSRGSTTVRTDGTWSMAVRVRQQLPNDDLGQDCTYQNAEFDYWCQLRADVLKSDGSIDYSFHLRPVTFADNPPVVVITFQ